MNFILLTHDREFLKPSNTGEVVKNVLGADRCQRIGWARKEPNVRLLELIKLNQVLLLFTRGEGDEVPWVKGQVSSYRYLLLLDGTWQQAKKMYRQSAYLHHLPWTSIAGDVRSNYVLRRNQLDGGLCTAECVIEALRVFEEETAASILKSEFDLFMSKY